MLPNGSAALSTVHYVNYICINTGPGIYEYNKWFYYMNTSALEG